MVSNQWKCGLCAKVFESKQLAVSHLRFGHTFTDTVPVVGVEATTWNRDRHHLFDREATDQHHTQSLVVPVLPQPVKFYRDESGAVLATSTDIRKSWGATSLHMHVEQAENVAAVTQTPKSASQPSDFVRASAMWHCVENNNSCHLQTGDVFKVGRFRVTVVQVCMTGEPQTPQLSPGEDNDGDPESVSSVVLQRNDSDSIPTCRICLGDASDVEEGPMIQAPCQCKGSNGNVHLNCLGKWLQMRCRMQDNREDGQFLSFKPPACEVCRTEFPVMISLGSGPDAEQASLLPGLPLIAPPFIVLSIPRSAGEDKERPYGERLVFAPVQPGAELRIGRARSVELRVDDVCVSRVHAMIKFLDGAFVLKDNGSKFQTVIRPTGPQMLEASPMRVQVGRTVLSMSLLDSSGDGVIMEEATQKQPRTEAVASVIHRPEPQCNLAFIRYIFQSMLRAGRRIVCCWARCKVKR